MFEIVIGVIGSAGVIWVLIYGGKTVGDVVKERDSKKSVLPDNSISQHLRYLIEKTEHLRFGDITRTVENAEGLSSIGVLKLNSVYTDLELDIDFDKKHRQRSQKESTRHRIDEIFELGGNGHVIIGGPGSGKTTSLNYIAHELAKRHLEKTSKIVPILIQLEDVRPSRTPSWIDLIASIEKLDAEEFSEVPCYWLLDGLDEISSDVLSDVIRCVSDLVSNRPQDKIVASSREELYVQNPQIRFFGFRVHKVQPYSKESTFRFIDKWYDSIEEFYHDNELESKKESLKVAVSSDESLQRLISLPMLATLTVMIHYTEGDLPKRKVLLYERAISHLLSKTKGWRSEYSGIQVKSPEVLSLASEIAFQAYFSGESLDSVPATGLKMGQIIEIAESHEATEINRQSGAQFMLRQRELLSKVELIARDNGLMQDNGSGDISFVHKTLQEFLVCYRFQRVADFDQKFDLAQRRHWHEPFILYASYAAACNNVYQPLAMIRRWMTLIQEKGGSDDYVLVIIVIGRMLGEMGRGSLINASEVTVFDVDTVNERVGIWTQTQKLLEEAVFRSRDALDRIEYLEVLGQLGDPRLLNYGPNDRDFRYSFSEVQGGIFLVGGDDVCDANAVENDCKTSPERDVFIGAYKVGSFPVTNAEYAVFVEEGGYSNLEFWKVLEGRRWLEGDANLQKDLQELTDSLFSRDFEPELADENFDRANVLDEALRMADPRSVPFFWSDGLGLIQNAPVVGVNYWEASAYCEWLTSKLRKNGKLDPQCVVRLPTEWEWENMATGPSKNKPYPWGSTKPTKDFAHFRDNGLEFRYALPVGVFTKGAYGHGGPVDVAGNVWEITRSISLSYETVNDAGRHNTDGLGSRVVKGGSWLSFEDSALRCAYRQPSAPHHVYVDLGFRVVIANEEFVDGNDVC